MLYFEERFGLHYENMSLLFYMLNGVSEPNLKQVYITSILEEHHCELQRAIAAK